MSLKNKLKIIEAETAQVDLRTPEFVYNGIIKSWSQQPNTKTMTHKITATIAGKKVGFLNFVQMENVRGGMISPKYDGKKIEKCIYLEEMNVEEKYRNLGIGIELLKNFGEIYSSKFAGWPVVAFYINPIAEYSYRKAVSLGFIPDYTLDESWIERDEDIYKTPEGEQLVKDLRGKLQDSVKGQEVWAFKREAEAEEQIPDLRTLNIEFIDDGEVENSDDGYKEHFFTISASVNGDVIGRMTFSRVEGMPGEIFNQKFIDQTLNFIYIEKLSVIPSYQNFGIGTALYKKFGETYEQNFQGEIVGRIFSNPIAEYAFRKAISMGYIPEEAFNEEYTFRNTSDRRKKLWTDLRNKLPENVQGPDVWAIKKDLRKILAVTTTIDIRNLKFENTAGEDDGNGNTNFSINAIIDGQDVGTMSFSEMKNPEDYEQNANGDPILYIHEIIVNSDYENLGIATELYREFGKIHDSRFSSYPVAVFFVNPIAEYAFRKAVSLGYINESVLDEKYVKHAPSTYYDKDLIKDLRGKLPEQYRGNFASRNDFRSIIAEAEEIDLRNMEIITEGPQIDTDIIDVNKYHAMYKISAKIDGATIGSIDLSEYKNVPGWFISDRYGDNIIEKILFVDDFRVTSKFRNLGIGTALYIKFGELYNQNFEGWPVGRYFVNPVAEYAFKKVVSLGYISDNSITEEYVNRLSRNYKDKSLINDLRNKLPEQYRGNLASKSITASEENPEYKDLNFTITKENESKYKVEAHYEGTILGHFEYEEAEDKNLTLEYIEVEDYARGMGLANLLMQKFGEIYNQQYYGWTINAVFIDPAAKSAFDKIVDSGLIPSSVIERSNIGSKLDFRAITAKIDNVNLGNKLPKELHDSE